MDKVDLSVIIVSWNTKDITDKCLVSMKKAVKKAEKIANTEVIVVENDSEDGTPEMIAKKHPWAKLMPSGSDLGYSKGNNWGFARINKKAEYILLLNNDAYVNEDTLVDSIKYMKSHPEADVMGCQLRYLDGRFQPSAGYLPTPFSVWGWLWGLDKIPLVKELFKQVHPKEREYYKKDRESGWVMGAFLFMKKDVFVKTNGFDENFFMYMEEVEWCKRVWDMGYKIFYTPKFWITHIDKASAFGDPVELAKIFRKEIVGLVYYMRKHFKNSMWWLLPVVKMGILVRLVVFTILNNKLRIDAYKRILTEI